MAKIQMKATATTIALSAAYDLFELACLGSFVIAIGMIAKALGA